MSINHIFFKTKESRSGSNRGPSAYQPNILPLGHTGSHLWRTAAWNNIASSCNVPRSLYKPANRVGAAVSRGLKSDVIWTLTRRGYPPTQSCPLLQVRTINGRRWQSEVRESCNEYSQLKFTFFPDSPRQLTFAWWECGGSCF